MELTYSLEHVQDPDECLDSSECLLPKTKAVVVASGHVGLPFLNTLTASEFFYRTDSLYDAGIYTLWIDASNGDGRIPVRLRWQDIERHLGLETSAKTMSDNDFDRLLRSVRAATFSRGRPSA